MTATTPKDPTARDAYTHGHHESVLRSHTWRTVENSAAYLLPHLREGLAVLDVGSGPGTISLDLARRVRPGQVIGVDASAEIVAQASGLAASSGVENVEFRVGDAYALEFDDASFDVVHAHQVLQHLAHPIDALKEFRRVLRPGGVLAVRDVDYGGVLTSPASDALTRWLELYHAVHAWNGGEPDAGRHLKSWVRAAGFTEVTATGSVWVFASDAEREWWGESWALRATESAFAAHAIESGHSDVGELQRISAGWREWTADSDGWMLMPHAEVIARA
ncbi:Ubiquinone/menaquinone biosynthesis C-methylase UbiE [Agromyces sp. CF514]|uniref:methyltransferase domain-containing protein n=1 Tax=Agromyces sp. CF514 TaxID=1881031 RepID=UPI0008EC1619|nr:methyltransferase domain-containing protein [Agromyces sp. CF514]SFR77230.1 Ubiquinone/menaquinone biosynthesis C-methylase UbiE [Agromyces sp. CF514]